MKDLDRVEQKLSQVSRTPAPPGLKEKVLATALTRSAQRHVLSPVLELLAAACMALIIVISLIDVKLSQDQDLFFAGLLGLERSAQSQTRPLSEEVIVEIFGEGWGNIGASFLIKRYVMGEKALKRKDYQRLNDVLERWENEL